MVKTVFNVSLVCDNKSANFAALRLNLLGDMAHAILAGGNEGLDYSIYLKFDWMINTSLFYFYYKTDFTGIFYTCTRLSNVKAISAFTSS